MLGTARTHLTRMVTWLRTLSFVTRLKNLWHYLNTGVSTINHQIRSAISSLHALTKQSKEQLLAQSRTLLVTLMKLVSILAILALGLAGLLAHLIVHLIQQLASKLWKRGQ